MTAPDSAALFDVAPIEADEEPALTAGARLRARQAERITMGQHPLAMHGRSIPLHRDAPRVLENDGGKGEPLRCGTCLFRVVVGGHARSFPKCAFGASPETPWKMPRASSGEASDVRAWWPACESWEAS